VPYRPRSQLQSFNSDWQQTVAWAQTQGIGANSIIPVYQLDLSRTQPGSGGYPMGRAERNLAILAANNPNQVTPAPSDNPSPTHVWTNATNDVGKVATGLIGIFTGSFEKEVWHSAQATYEGIIHPSTLEGHGFGGTLSNWLDKTLLSFVPGATDVGALLTGGPAALLDHPVISLLDVMPDIGGEAGIAARLARRAGSPEAARALSALRIPGAATGIKALGRKIGSSTLGGSAGMSATGALVAKTSVYDRITTMASKAGPGGAGVGPMISKLMGAIDTATTYKPDQAAFLLDNANAEFNKLPDDEKLLIQKVLDTNVATKGDAVRQALKPGSGLSPGAKQVITEFMDRALPFAQQGGILRGDMAAMRMVNGDTGFFSYSSPHLKSLLDSQREADRARGRALESLSTLEPHVDRYAALHGYLPEATQHIRDATVAARREVASDQSLNEPITFAPAKQTRFRQLRNVGTKRLQAQALLNQNGLMDDAVAAMEKDPRPDQIIAIAKAAKARLSSWGPQSVAYAEMTSPAMTRLYQTFDSLERWGHDMNRMTREIDKLIHGEARFQEKFAADIKEQRTMGMDLLKTRLKRMREQRREQYRNAEAQISHRFGERISQQENGRVIGIRYIEDRAEQMEQAEIAEKGKISNARADEIAAWERVQKIQAKDRYRSDMKNLRREYKDKIRIAKLERDRDLKTMGLAHHKMLEKAQRGMRDERAAVGEITREIVGYSKALAAHQKNLWDHPADQYRNVKDQLVKNRLMETEKTEHLKIATDQYLESNPYATEERIAAIRNNPDHVAELIMSHAEAILSQPDLDPEIAVEARAELANIQHTAMEELKYLVGRGYKVPYIPTATHYDEAVLHDSMAPLIGHGIPTPDMAKAKVWDLTPRKDDFAVGITKAIAQELQRDSTIHLVEQYLSPMAVRNEDMTHFIQALMHPEEREFGGNIPHEEMVIRAKTLGYTAFDPHALFGFSLPRWPTNETMFLPTSMVNAIRQLEHERNKYMRALGTSNKVFRYAILGLSPRYTAHVLFGGALMAALRTSPMVFTLIPRAVQDLRDGLIPSEALGHHFERGIEDPAQIALTKTAKAGGRFAGRKMIEEHIETVQKVGVAAAKPIHFIRAVADLNYRLTNYVRNLQAAVVYLDGAAKVDRRDGIVTVEDPHTGREISVSSERAVAEGIRAVQKVYGHLGAMSPLERAVSQSVMPFYGWQRHILGYVMSFPFDHPWRAMVLSQMAYNSSKEVPLAWPIRIQFLLGLGSPDAQGNVSTIDIRPLDPFRDVSNYMTWTGLLESLNPAISAPMTMALGQEAAVWGSSSLYPNVSYNAFYGIETGSSGGSWSQALAQWAPQAGAIMSMFSAQSTVRREWNTNRSAAIKSLLESFELPFASAPINLKQQAARSETARYESASKAALAAFQTGNFGLLEGYTTVPYPLNPAYQVTPAQLEALYNEQQKAVPGVAPIETLVKPPSPLGW
jgi:hypothetical protein